MRRMTVITLLVSLIIAAAMIAGGCGGTTVKKTDSKDVETTDSKDVETTDSTTVNVTDSGFEPNKITVKPGTSIELKNLTTSVIWVTSIKDSVAAAAAANNSNQVLSDVSMLDAGNKGTFTFNESSKLYIGDDRTNPLVVEVK